MSLTPQVREQIERLIHHHPVVLFMKGTRQSPECGFSARTVQLLDHLISHYETYDVLSDPEIRNGIKEYSDWPTIPQLYVRGVFVGGCDILQEMHANGEIYEVLGLEAPRAEAPDIAVTDACVPLLSDARARSEVDTLHLQVSPRFQYRLGFGPAQGGELRVETNGFVILVDRDSASRAHGLRLDAVQTPEGLRITIDNPNVPKVKSIQPQELRARLDAGESMPLFDVRTPEEAAKACIQGAVLVDQNVAEQIEQLPRDVHMVFFCHHGGRSRAAAEHFASMGFTNVYNLEGGIDAWCCQVDPTIPRY
jgi:monothiol glutaredoxin